MRILTVGNMYPPHHLGGYELMWRSAVHFLRERGHEVRVLTTNYRSPGPDLRGGEDDDVFRELQWYWRDHDFPKLNPGERTALERANAESLRRQLRDLRPEVVSWWAMGGMSLSLVEQVRRAGLPANAVVVDDWLLYGPKVDPWTRLGRRLGPLSGLAERIGGVPTPPKLEDAAVWLFASETLRRRAEHAGWRLSRVRVAHPGIDLELFDGPRVDRAVWAWRLLYCGRIDDRKGIDLAIEALPQLPGETTLTVVGGGDEDHLAALQALVERLGLQSRVKFERRPREDLPAVYAAADVTLFPVRWEEPFGLVPLESMAMGTPVVASGRGGSSEYLRADDNCLLFDPDEGPAALASAIRRLADDPGLRERIGEAGLTTARGFDERKFNEAVEETLLQATGDRRPTTD